MNRSKISPLRVTAVACGCSSLELGHLRGAQEQSVIPLQLWPLRSLNIQAWCGTFNAVSVELERYQHEEDVVGSRCGRDFGGFCGLSGLCLARRLGPGSRCRYCRRRDHRRRDRLEPVLLRPRLLPRAELLLRTRRLSVLFRLCRCSGRTCGRSLLLAPRAFLEWLRVARAPRAHLRLIN